MVRCGRGSVPAAWGCGEDKGTGLLVAGPEWQSGVWRPSSVVVQPHTSMLPPPHPSRARLCSESACWGEG